MSDSTPPETEEIYGLSPETASSSPVVARPEPPVPAVPEHVCPNCDYLLTGLTSRRCPECGEAFTLVEARRKAEEQNPTPELARDFRAIRLERTMLMVGGGLFVVGYLMPLIFSRRFTTWFLVSELTIVLLFAGLYWHYSQRRLPQMALLIGLTLAILNGCWAAILISAWAG